jgi:ABC-type polysaccharide/polyol phosphate transport system ATPase subunit
VLDGIDLHLEGGDRIGIIGPNGAGKSTLLDILAGQIGRGRGQRRLGRHGAA